jgi:hypothetical protein
MAWIMAGTATLYAAEITGGQNFGDGQGRLMAKFYRLLSRTDESDRQLLLHMARKMAGMMK